MELTAGDSWCPVLICAFCLLMFLLSQRARAPVCEKGLSDSSPVPYCTMGEGMAEGVSLEHALPLTGCLIAAFQHITKEHKFMEAYLPTTLYYTLQQLQCKIYSVGKQEWKTLKG